MKKDLRAMRNAMTPNNPPLQETAINMGILKRGYRTKRR